MTVAFVLACTHCFWLCPALPGIDFFPMLAMRKSVSAPASFSFLTAAKSGDVATVHQMLLASPKIVHHKDAAGRTTLHMASLRDDHQLAHLLLEFGANVNARDTQGRTPLMLVGTRQWHRVCRVLTENGADILATDNRGDSAFSIARNARSPAYLYYRELLPPQPGDRVYQDSQKPPVTILLGKDNLFVMRRTKSDPRFSGGYKIKGNRVEMVAGGIATFRGILAGDTLTLRDDENILDNNPDVFRLIVRKSK